MAGDFTSPECHSPVFNEMVLAPSPKSLSTSRTSVNQICSVCPKETTRMSRIPTLVLIGCLACPALARASSILVSNIGDISADSSVSKSSDVGPLLNSYDLDGGTFERTAATTADYGTLGVTATSINTGRISAYTEWDD